MKVVPVIWNKHRRLFNSGTLLSPIFASLGARTSNRHSHSLGFDLQHVKSFVSQELDRHINSPVLDVILIILFSSQLFFDIEMRALAWLFLRDLSDPDIVVFEQEHHPVYPDSDRGHSCGDAAGSHDGKSTFIFVQQKFGVIFKLPVYLQSV